MLVNYGRVLLIQAVTIAVNHPVLIVNRVLSVLAASNLSIVDKKRTMLSLFIKFPLFRLVVDGHEGVCECVSCTGLILLSVLRRSTLTLTMINQLPNANE